MCIPILKTLSNLIWCLGHPGSSPFPRVHVGNEIFTVQFKPRQLISSNYTGALAKLTSKHENSHSALPEVIYSVGVPLNKINESLQKIFQTATF